MCLFQRQLVRDKILCYTLSGVMLDSDREGDSHAIEEALLQEVQAKPRDVHLRVFGTL